MRRTVLWSAVVLGGAGFLLARGLLSRGPDVRGAVGVGREEGWRSDLDFLLGEIRRRHYVYRQRPLPAAMLADLERLRRDVPRLSDERMLVELQRLMAHLGDGHTYVYPLRSRVAAPGVLPLRFYLFPEGLFVVGAASGFDPWIGRRVVSFDDTPAEVALSRLTPFVSRDNAMGVTWIGPSLLRVPAVLEAAGIVPDGRRVRLEVEDPGGRRSIEELAPVPAPPERGIWKLAPPPEAPNPPPRYLQDVGRHYWFEEIAGSGVLYFQFNEVLDGDGESLASFAARLGRALEASRPRALVVDVRHNNGGNADLLPPLMEVLKRFDSQGPPPRLIVLTGRNTFSAAQIFIALVDRDTRAAFAGEPSSSRPNFVGEEVPFLLPWSGATGSISNRYHEQIPSDTRDWIEPDIPVALTAADYFANRDPVLEAILRRLAAR